MFLFQKWFGSSFPEDVWAWWLLMHWLQLQFTPCEALPSVWIGFAWQYSQACGHPCCLCIFSFPISSFQSTLHLTCFDTALLEQPPPPFSNDPLWLTLFVEGGNDCLYIYIYIYIYSYFHIFGFHFNSFILVILVLLYNFLLFLINFNLFVLQF